MTPRRHRPRILFATIALGAAALLAAPAPADFDPDSPIAPQLAAAEAAVEAIIAVPDNARTYNNTLGALDDLVAHLDFNTGMTLFLAYVSTDAAERERGQRAEEDLQSWIIDLTKREDLYRAIKAYADSSPRLRPEQWRLLEHTMRDYRRAGMDLPPSQRDKLKAVQKEISRLSIEFEKNIRDDETAVFVARDELTGMPDDWVNGLERAGDLYVITMDYPTFIPVQDYCDNELTRMRSWIAYKRRGGQQNAKVIERILKLRAEAARMLGYRHAADYETEIKMSKNADTVKAFYEKLRPLVREKAALDHAEFLAAKRAQTGNPNAKLQPWDYSYYKNRLMKEKYAVDAEKVREYFPLQLVIDGLFGITQSLHGLEYREVTDRAGQMGMPLWHEDVRLYEVWDKASGDMLGMFYIDLHPRPNKYSHAAQWGLRQHKKWTDGTYEKPLAALVCNFTKPTADKPSLLTHDEVETFFHEFGHCLHTILSTADTFEFAGTGVERDFVEAPSQMFENWIWDADVLKTFARHYETGEPFPDDLLAGMLKARHLGSGMAAERQFFYGLFDMTCHVDPDGEIDTTQLAHDLWDPAKENVELYDPVPGTWFQAAFGHLTGYQAGYYGYQWSLVYACDMFQRFKELGMLDPEAGKYYRDKILARGGTLDGLDLVKDYLGREPDLSAYLKHLGLEPEKTAAARE
jgi:thimet oligopeptidase